jgi:hypothetical protein
VYAEVIAVNLLKNEGTGKCYWQAMGIRFQQDFCKGEKSLEFN